MRIRQCVVAVNRLAGSKNALRVFESVLEGPLKKGGVPHQVVVYPEPRGLEQLEGDPLRRLIEVELTKPAVDALVLCGGDGTANILANLFYGYWLGLRRESLPGADVPSASAPPVRASHPSTGDTNGTTALRDSGSATSTRSSLLWLHKPIVLLPCGSVNALASHVYGCETNRSPTRAITAFVTARTEPLHLWSLQRRVTTAGVEQQDERQQPAEAAPSSHLVREEGQRCFVSYVHLGVLAAQQSNWAWLRQTWNDNPSLPTISASRLSNCSIRGDGSAVGSRWLWMCTLLYTIVFAKLPTVQGWLEVRRQKEETPATLEREGGDGEDDSREWIRVEGPLKLLMISPLSSQGSLGILTRGAGYSPRNPSLSVTVATAEASRARLWHLLRQEALDGELEEEDGVRVFEHVDRIRLGIERGKASVVVDGEEVRCAAGDVLEVSKTDFHLNVCTC